jgi:hypothetical protein
MADGRGSVDPDEPCVRQLEPDRKARRQLRTVGDRDQNVLVLSMKSRRGAETDSAAF